MNSGPVVATMRPSGQGLVWLGVQLEFFAITILVRNALFGGYPTVAAVLFIVSTITIASLILLRWRNSRVTLTFDGLEITNSFGRSRAVAMHEIAEVMNARHVEFALTHYRCIAVFDASGRAILRANEKLWNTQSMVDLALAFGDRVKFVPQPVTREQLLARFPYALGFVTRHPYRSLLILIAVLVAIGVGVDAFSRSLQ